MKLSNVRFPNLLLSSVVIFTALINYSCQRDILFVDDLIGMHNSNDLLRMEYQAETTTFNRYGAVSDEVMATRQTPIIVREKVDFKMSKTGQVEIFTEYLPTSNPELFAAEGLAADPDVVKYTHYVNGTMKHYDKHRKVLFESNNTEIQNEYATLYQKIVSGKIPEKYLKSSFTAGSLFLMPQDFVDNSASNTNQRTSSPLENEYDTNPNFNVVRNSTTDNNGNLLIGELIFHKASNTLSLASTYDANYQLIGRSVFTYKNDNNNLQLDFTQQEFYEDINTPLAKKSVIITDYDYFNITLSL